MEAAVRGILARKDVVSAADDVSGAYGSLLEARKAAKDSDGALHPYPSPLSRSSC